MKKLYLFIIIILYPKVVFCDEINWMEIDRYLQKIYSDEEITSIIEILEFYFENPIVLDNARLDALTSLPTIDLPTSNAIIKRYRENPNIDNYFLLEGLALTDAQKIIILNGTIRNKSKIQEPLKANYYIRNEERLEEVRGLRENKYLGNKYDIYQRLNVKYSDYQLQAIGNKNLGEIYLFDFYSIGFKYQQKDLKLIVGDYAVNYSAGNVLRQGFSLNKGSDYIAAAIPYLNNINLNTSISRINFFRGAAFENNFRFLWHNFTISTFVSSLKRPANVDTAKNKATSIYTTNYFRTKTEINKKDALEENAFGANLAYNYKNLILGVTYFELEYNYPLKSSSSRAFDGSYSNLISSYGIYNAKNFTIGYEYSIYSYQFPGLKLFTYFKLGLFEFVTHYRNYHYKYRSFWGYNFGESSYPANEEGIYNAIRVNFDKNLTTEAYLDLYHTHKRTYSVEKPIKGVDYSIRNYYKNKIIGNFYLKVKSEAKTDGFKPKGAKNQIIYIQRRNDVRFEYERRIIKNLIATIRFDATDVYFEQKKPAENGYAGYFELDYDIFKNLSVISRISIFNTESYTSAIWHYEYRMPTSVYSNPLYDEGSKILFRINYSPLKNINLYFAYTRLEKPKLEKLGSSYDEINSNKDNRFYFLVNFKF